MGHATADYELRWKVWLGKAMLGVSYALCVPLWIFGAAFALFFGLFGTACAAYIAYYVIVTTAETIGRVLLLL